MTLMVKKVRIAEVATPPPGDASILYSFRPFCR